VRVIVSLVAGALAVVLPQPAAAQIDPGDLESIFNTACFQGEVTLAPGQETPITLADLPSSLRRRFGKHVSESVWQLNSTTPTYLFIVNYKPSRTTSPKVCGLATQSLDINHEIKVLGARLNGPSLTPLRMTITGAQWLDAERGYIAAATKADHYTVLEVKQLTREQQLAALKIIPSLGVLPAVP
jgi:hypothetical protein